MSRATFVCGTCQERLPEDLPSRRFVGIDDHKRICEPCLIKTKGMTFDDVNKALIGDKQAA